MDKIREIFEAKYLIPEGIFHVSAEGFDEYAISDQCSMMQYDSLCYQCSYLNDSYRAFRRGYESAKASQWISVEDRLPEHGNLVVAAHLYKYGTQPDCAVCCFYDDVFLPHADGLKANNYDGGAVITLDMDVTHWMPLPEGPTE